MATHVAVLCKLPNGLVLSHPMNHDKRVTLNGANKAHIIGSGYGTTMVEESFWNDWLAMNEKFPPVVSGAIFTAKDGKDMDAKAKENEKRATGFEGMPQETKDIKKADKESD